MKKCAMCGTENLSDAKFCDKCGAKFKTAFTSNTDAVSSTSEGVASNDKTGKAIVAGIVISVIFIAIAIIITTPSVYDSGSVNDNGNDDEDDVPILKEYTVTFDSIGGSVNGRDTYVITASGTFKLPHATKDGFKFLGWFDAKEGGNLVGLAGSEYTPTGDFTFYAHWDTPVLQIASDHLWVGGNGYVMSYTPKVTNSLNGEEITDFKVEIPKAKDQTGCLREDGSRVYGMMKYLIPGTYTAEVIVSKTGFVSASQTITVKMPPKTLESIDADTVVGQKWTTDLTMKPDDACIELYTVEFNGQTATSTQYDAGVLGKKGFYITCKAEGDYSIHLVLSVPDISSSVKVIKLHAEKPSEQTNTHPNAPSIKSVSAIKYGPSEPNTFYLSAIGAENYDTLIWNYGDGTIAENTLEETIHQFAPGVYTVKCTAKNIATGEFATVSVRVEVLDSVNAYSSVGNTYGYQAIFGDHSNSDWVGMSSDGKDSGNISPY